MSPTTCRWKDKMEPTTSAGAAGFALTKFLLTQMVLGAIATALAFLILPPRTKGEFCGRMIATLIASFVFGPSAVAVLHSWYPSVFESAQAVALLNGQDPSVGILYVTAPIQVLTGMPAWWVIGAFMRWFDKRQGHDLASMMSEFRSEFLPPRGGTGHE